MSSDVIKLVGVALVALVGGFGLGRLPLGGEVPDPEPQAADEKPAPEPEPKPHAAPEPEPSVTSRSHDPASTAHCQSAEIELRFLKARRDAQRERDETIHRDFTDGTTIEEALPWAELAESVVETCLSKSLSLRFVECSEYPCVAALAGPAGVLNLNARDELEYTASEALESCEPLTAAFGEDYPVEAASFLPFPVSCPDGEDEQAYVMLLLDPSGDAFRDFQSDPVDRSEAARVNRWTYRRAHEVDHKWICADEAQP